VTPRDTRAAQAAIEALCHPDALLDPESTDRRSRTRFPLKLTFTWRTLERKARSGMGRILNVSSTGLLAACGETFTLGTALELTVKWPVRLPGRIPLSLVMIGRIVRCELSGFAVAASQLRLAPARQWVAEGARVRISEKQTQDLNEYLRRDGPASVSSAPRAGKARARPSGASRQRDSSLK
jgi:hypothetical protein